MANSQEGFPESKWNSSSLNYMAFNLMKSLKWELLSCFQQAIFLWPFVFYYQVCIIDWKTIVALIGHISILMYIDSVHELGIYVVASNLFCHILDNTQNEIESFRVEDLWIPMYQWNQKHEKGAGHLRLPYCPHRSQVIKHCSTTQFDVTSSMPFL